jgi:hypothetical protein
VPRRGGARVGFRSCPADAVNGLGDCNICNNLVSPLYTNNHVSKV